MKLTINGKPFLDRLERICAVAARKATLPILSHFLLDAQPGVVRLRATDLETTLTDTLTLSDGGYVDMAGACCLPAKKLLELVKLSPGEITISWDGKQAHIATGNIKYKIPALDAAEFPAFPEITGAQTVGLSAALLQKALERVAFASGHENIERYVLTSVLFHLKAKNRILTLVSTNGKNMAIATEPLLHTADEPKKDEKYILPLNGAQDLIKALCAFSEETVSIRLGGGHALFAKNTAPDGMALAVRLMDGTYPNYTKIVPESPATTMEVLSDGFQRALARVALIDPSVTIEFTGCQAHIKAQNPNTGEAAETFSAEELIGPPLTLRLYAPPLLRALKAIDAVRVTIGLSGPQTPVVLRSSDVAEAVGYKYLTMPITGNS